ncbi:MAG: hypothetical protein COA99_12390 [Moraxellaceae bacterium]|nr:MAG: hypothetical protein COA99_12390 [Moraxellaceae bacterium]
MIDFAQNGLLIILSLLLIVHICVLLKFVPYKNIWGGRLKSDSEMYRFEVVSIIANLFFLFIILVQSDFLTINFPRKMMTFILCSMAVLFAFNTFGNIVSKNKVEQRLFTPITIILTIFTLMIALSN